MKKIGPKPGQYSLYIPKGMMVILPGDTIHAGGFCFGSKLDTQVPRTFYFRTIGFISFLVTLKKL